MYSRKFGIFNIFFKWRYIKNNTWVTLTNFVFTFPCYGATSQIYFLLPDLWTLTFISYQPFLEDIKEKRTEKSPWFPSVFFFPKPVFLLNPILFLSCKIFKNSFLHVTARIMTYSCTFFTTNGPMPLRVYGKYAQLIILRFLYRTMSLPNIESEKPAIYTVHAAFEALVQTRPQIEPLPEPHFIDSFCTQM